jgi:hypothetical protein
MFASVVLSADPLCPVVGTFDTDTVADIITPFIMRQRSLSRRRRSKISEQIAACTTRAA